MSITPTTMVLSLSSRGRGTQDRLHITLYGASPGNVYGSMWTRSLLLPSDSRDDATARLRAAAVAILLSTGGFPTDE